MVGATDQSATPRVTALGFGVGSSVLSFVSYTVVLALVGGSVSVRDVLVVSAGIGIAITILSYTALRALADGK